MIESIVSIAGLFMLLIVIAAFLAILILPYFFVSKYFKDRNWTKWFFIVFLSWVGLIFVILLPKNNDLASKVRERYIIYAFILVVLLLILQVYFSIADKLNEDEPKGLSRQEIILDKEAAKVAASWKKDNSNISDIMKIFLKDKKKLLEKNNCINISMNDLDLKEASKIGVSDKYNSSSLIKMSEVKLNNNNILVAIYKNTTEEGSGFRIYNQNPGGNTVTLEEYDNSAYAPPKATFIEIGKNAPYLMQTEFKVCSCGCIGDIYMLNIDNSLEKIVNVSDERAKYTYIDLDGDKTCEIVLEMDVDKTADINKVLLAKFGSNYNLIYPRSSHEFLETFSTTIYKWNGKKFELVGSILE